jgi:tripartite-type tricarboxylate transporter receptor subunit TctC
MPALAAFLALCATLIASDAALAEYPDRPIRLLVPFPAGDAEFSALIRAEIAQWREFANSASIRLD